MIGRRNILRAALAAPALILPVKTDAAFISFGATSSLGTSGLVKPNGTPTLIASSLSSGMLLYVFDTGTGLYNIVRDCSPAHAIDPTSYWGASPNYFPGSPPQDPKQSLALPESTPYGDAINWGSLNIAGEEKPGGGALIQLGTPDDIRTATNMTARGTGPLNGVTYFATHRTKGPNLSGLIFGRYSNPDVLSYISTIFSVNSSNSDYRNGFGWSAAADGDHPQFAASTNAYQNVLCSTVVTLENPSSAGVTRIIMYCNGVTEFTLTGQTVCDVPASVAFNEDQLQWGAGFHVFAGQSYNNYNGNVYQNGIVGRTWSAVEAISFAANPYQMLHF